MATTKTKATRPLKKLTSDERAILTHLAAHRTATLHELAARFEPRVTPPRRWHYATEVAPKRRRAFVASLRARNGMRRPLRAQLAAKLRPGIYRITPAGRKRLAQSSGQ